MFEVTANLKALYCAAFAAPWKSFTPISKEAQSRAVNSWFNGELLYLCGALTKHVRLFFKISGDYFNF